MKLFKVILKSLWSERTEVLYCSKDLVELFERKDEPYIPDYTHISTEEIDCKEVGNFLLIQRKKKENDN